MTDSVEWFLNQAGRWPRLTPDQELTLGRQVQAWLTDPSPSAAVERRGRRARDRLVACNLRLVVAIAGKYRHHASAAIGVEDLIQAGNEGLIRGVEKYDPARGYRFSTYAYWWIQQGVTRRLAIDGRTIRMPQDFSLKASNLNKAYHTLAVKHDREPTRAELADAIGLRLHEFNAVMAVGSRPVSLDQLIGTEGTALIEMISSPGDEPIDPLCEELRNRLKRLDPQAAELVRRLYGVDRLPQSITNASRAVGLSIPRAKQTLEAALQILRGDGEPAAPPGVEAIGEGDQMGLALPPPDPLPVVPEPTRNDAMQAGEPSAARPARRRRTRAQRSALLPGLAEYLRPGDPPPASQPAPAAEGVACAAGCAASVPF